MPTVGSYANISGKSNAFYCAIKREEQIQYRRGFAHFPTRN